jgi:eukaryotic-like serine/threonine-protein kinase
MKSSLDAADFLSPPQGAGEIGRLGPYRVLKVLGNGGMGAVFLAEDPQLQRTVALKVMQPDAAKKATSRERFLREARATAKIEHDHIVTIYQVGEDRGVPYLAMQYLKGITLEDLLDKKEGKTGMALGLGQVLKIGREIARGLAAAHEHNLIHRDIKPANIWLDASAGGRVKILDFGLVRVAAESRLTTLGAAVGTPAYMAPEQARTDKIDVRADLFSLGVVLYRMCTGRVPWLGNEPSETVIAVLTEEPTPVQELNPSLPPKLAKLIMTLLAKKPEDRPPSAKAVAEAIQAIERQQPAAQLQAAAPVAAAVPAKTAGAWHDPMEATQMLVRLPDYKGKAQRRRRLLVIGGVGVMAVLLLGGAFIALQSRSGTAAVSSNKGGAVARANDPPASRRDAPATRTTAKVPDSLPREQDKEPVKYMTNSIGMKLAPIPPGEFTMGASDAETNRVPGHSTEAGNMPHRVRITKGFYMAAYPVTVGQFRKFIQDSGYKPHRSPNGEDWQNQGPNNPQTDEYPVVMVSWKDADEFCQWLTKREGRPYRLPTEAEWEYACRADTQTAYFFGDDPKELPKYGWFHDNSTGKRHPVGQLRENKWGLFDMHGNVYQWVADWYDPNYYKNSPKDDPTGPASGTGKVMRGGEYSYSAWSCRSAALKVRQPTGYVTQRLGFRVLASEPNRP